MPRQARLDAPGTLHHVIIRGIEKRQIVDDLIDRENFVSRMGKLAIETETAIYAWALLTNHAHILLRSSSFGLSGYMRRLLTGYAVYYNLRHSRHGHLFQNRYKSIVCEEDVYFLELVRYIHLNPLRAKLVDNLDELAAYPWCGHSTLVGHRYHEWQDTAYLLTQFGEDPQMARQAYQTFIANGAAQGQRPELIGGGLVRSLGGWSQVSSQRKKISDRYFDDRILGSSAFVGKIIGEVDEKRRRSFRRENLKGAEKYLRQACQEGEISISELQSGSRRGIVPTIRVKIALELITNYGLTLAESARWLGVSTSTISKILSRKSR
jgi:putative transposase